MRAALSTSRAFTGWSQRRGQHTAIWHYFRDGRTICGKHWKDPAHTPITDALDGICCQRCAALPRSGETNDNSTVAFRASAVAWYMQPHTICRCPEPEGVPNYNRYNRSKPHGGYVIVCQRCRLVVPHRDS